MGDAKYYPDCWSEYCALRKRRGEKPEPKWARFAARYRVAGNFQRGDYFWMTEKSTRAYDHAIKFLLCYSAFECACDVMGRKPYKVHLGDGGEWIDECRKLARRHFGQFSNEEFPLRSALSSKVLQTRLSEFFEGASDDLMPIAMALRHLFAHGHWTPSTTGTLTKGACRCLNLLSQTIMREADKLLREHVLTMEGS